MKFSELLPTLSANGKDFEQIVGWMFQNHPEWRANYTDVWQWDEYPLRWGRDKGIDLVIRDCDGRDWAVQAKNYAADYYVTKKDVNKWGFESARPQIYGLILVATTNKMHHDGQEVLDGQEKTVVRIMLDDLLAMNLDWPASVNDLHRAEVLPAVDPDPHQEKAIADVVAHFETNDKAQCLMACGTGKSYTGRWIAEALGAQTTMVLVPTLNLIRQISTDYRRLNSDYRSLIVCSDEYAGKDVGNDQIKDVPVTSSPEEIRDFLQGSGEKVIFSTYHSSNLVADAQRLYAPAFDLVICDEAHNLAGWMHENRDYCTVLFEDRIKAVKRLFMTATPRYWGTSGKDTAEAADIVLASMDDPELFGEVAHCLSFREAISQGLIRDYKILVNIVRDEQVYNSIRLRDLYQLPNFDTPVAANEAAFSDLLIGLMHKYQLSKGITFHSNTSKAKRFSGLLRKMAPFRQQKVDTGVVDGTMNTSERVRVLNSLDSSNGKDAVVSNCRVLTEGVNVPQLDFVSFVDPKNSKVSVIQALSRALRKAGGKDYGYVILPVFVSEDKLPEQEILKSRFAHVVRVLNVLAQEDDAMFEELQSLRIRLGAERPVNSVDTGRIIIEEFEAGLPVDRSFYTDALEEHLIDRCLSSGFQLIDDMVKWTQEHNGEMPERRRDGAGTEEFRLYGRFTNAMHRYQNWPDALKTYAEEHLGEYPWYHPAQSAKDFKIERLMAWIDNNNGAIPPTSAKCPLTGLGVGKMVSRARLGEAPDVAKALEAKLGLTWNQTKESQVGWESAINFIRKFKRIPQFGEEFEGFPVGAIIMERRCKPSKAFRALIEPVCRELGIDWEISPKKLDTLSKAHATADWIEAHNGQMPVFRQKDANGVPVGSLLARARQNPFGDAAQVLTQRLGQIWL